MKFQVGINWKGIALVRNDGRIRTDCLLQMILFCEMLIVY